MARVKDTSFPWERQAGEPEKAHEAFLIYKNTGPGRKKIDVARQLDKSYRLITRWAAEWDWKSRVEAFDRDVERKAKAQAEAEQKKMIARHIAIGMKVQEKGIEALKQLKPEKIDAMSVRFLLDFGTKLERESRSVTQKEATAQQDAVAILANVLERAWGDKEGAGKDGEP